jgi:hypothetical protein
MHLRNSITNMKFRNFIASNLYNRFTVYVTLNWNVFQHNNKRFRRLEYTEYNIIAYNIVEEYKLIARLDCPWRY